jgi:uncharacterized protein YndB with AHSA1/START domain
MTFQAATSVEIAAPPATVFAWLTERDKLSRWVEGDLDMMADPSQLHTGYTGESTFKGADGSTRKLAYEITAYEPPLRYAYRQTQEGATTLAEFRLSPTGSATLVEASTSTEWDVDQMTGFQQMEQQAEAQIANAPSFVQDMVRRQLEQAESQMQTANPAIDAKMKAMFDDSLAKLKEAVEANA